MILMKFVFKVVIFNTIKKNLSAHQKSSTPHTRAAAHRLRNTDFDQSEKKKLVLIENCSNWKVTFQDQRKDGEESEPRHFRPLFFRSGSSKEIIGANDDDEEIGEADHAGDHAETSNNAGSTLTFGTDSTKNHFLCKFVPEFWYIYS